MDTEHWFAPMKRRAYNGGDIMGLYLSTNQTTPFYVKIKNKNKVLDSVQISKGSPRIYSISNTESLQTNNTDSLQVPISKGLNVTADQKFFANLRFSQNNHAEIITSKGRAGLGKHFFIAYAPFRNAASHLNYTIGIIATEDNTTVNVLGNTVLLNKGQSYLIEGRPPGGGNIGKEIVADKPVSVTNGNFNGQYATTDPDAGSDILMDQSIPVERLGKEYIVMSGNGDFSDGMESALIIATEDATNIFFNNETAPSATLNKGDYLLMPTSKYRFINSNTSTALIKSTQNIYVFQLLSGSGSVAAGGMNYVPPLNCYLPRKIDEIGYVNENPGYLYSSYYTTHPTKLNIITQTGANVTVNGNLLNGTYGPYPVTGTTEWITFSVPNVSSNITIESTKAITAGIAAGDDAVGYGGYFAGASSLPIITKSGECIPGVKLEVDDSYDNYQWKKKNNVTGIFEDIAGANFYQYNPTVPGDYKCEIGTLSCGIMETPEYRVLNCPVSTVQNFEVCKSQSITTQLSSPTITINSSETKITVRPQLGTATLSGDIITYIPNPGFADGATDSFSYYMESTGTYPESETVQVKIILRKLITNDADLYGCITNGIATFDLSTATVSTQPNITVSYYENLSDAQSNNSAVAINNFTQYSTAATKVYAHILSEFGCSDIATINLFHHPVPNIDLTKFIGEYCDDNLDGSEIIDLSAITAAIVNNPSDFDVLYFLSGQTTPLSNQFTLSSPTTLTVEVRSKKGCPSAVGTLHFKLKDQISLAAAPDVEICDNDIDGTESITLSDYVTLFGTNATAAFYNTFSDAQAENNILTASQAI